MPDKSKNDIAWETLFQRHKILEEIDRKGAYEISSKAINREREARLATKFDHRIQLPYIFKKNQLTIQPNTRGTYLIGRFESYENLPDNPSVKVKAASFPPHIETINPTNLYSESSALLCAYHTGIITDVLEQEVALTVFGRMSAGHFGYYINNQQTGGQHEINVEGAQLEIDCGFEGESVFAIFEAKNQSVDDFLVRQLYYPYRLWLGKTKKQIVPVFMYYSNANSVFSFYVYSFTQDAYYNSIKLVAHKKYQLVPIDIELADIKDALQVRIRPEPKNIPFPQADSFTRIIDLLTQLYRINAPISQDYITTNYAFDLRQTQYYTQAANYLGLVERHYDKEQGVTYALTQQGVTIMSMHPQARNLALVECILEHRVFHQTLSLYLEQVMRPTKEQVVDIMKAARLGIEKTTIPRRAQTVLLWIDWILKLTRP